MKELFYLSLGIQGLFMFGDEFYFHRRRGLPLWERRGHPIDTLFFLAALVAVWIVGSNPWTIALAVLSTIVITKDEFVHAKVCAPAELWTHAVLFILHPIVLALAHLSHGQWGAEVLLLLVGFLFYQIFYWNVYAQPTPQ